MGKERGVQFGVREEGGEHLKRPGRGSKGDPIPIGYNMGTHVRKMGGRRRRGKEETKHLEQKESLPQNFCFMGRERKKFFWSFVRIFLVVVFGQNH